VDERSDGFGSGLGHDQARGSFPVCSRIRHSGELT
jgi:hypothetical protein